MPYQRKRSSIRGKSLAVLNIAALALAVFTIAIGGLALLPGGKEMVEENFGLLRVLAYAGWAAGLLVLAWGAGLAAGMGTFSVRAIGKAWKDADLVRVRRAVSLALVANAVALAASPAGLLFGDRYTWPVFVGHMTASLVIVALATFVSLVRLRAFVDDIAPAPLPIPARAGFVEPTGF